jgi:hypothetical protein
MSSHIPNYLYITTSTIHGLGIFTKRAYLKDDVVFTSKRKFMVIEDPDIPIDYIEEHPIIPKIHCPQIERNTYHVYSFDSFMNHSKNPNTTIQYHDDFTYSHVAIRDIEENEELTVSYDEVYSAEYPDSAVSNI